MLLLDTESRFYEETPRMHRDLNRYSKNMTFKSLNKKTKGNLAEKTEVRVYNAFSDSILKKPRQIVNDLNNLNETGEFRLSKDKKTIIPILD